MEVFEMMDEDEPKQVAENMVKYGGGFVQALGTALYRADRINVARIREAFPEYWKQYKEIGD